MLVDSRSKIVTDRSRVVIRGTAFNSALLEIRTDNARFQRVKGTPAKFRVRTERLEEGRNVVKIRAIGATGRSRQVKAVIIKE